MAKQLALPLPMDKGDPDNDDYCISPANEHVITQLSAWDAWPYGAAIITGEKSSGKTIFGKAFMRYCEGIFIDNAPAMPEEELFHSWNQAQHEQRPILFAARNLPGHWGKDGTGIALPDLRSRMGASHHIAIGTPDIDLSAQLLQKFLRQSGLMLNEQKAIFAATRAPRSYAAITILAQNINRIALERKSAVTMPLLKEALAELPKTA